jgi:hypothetical protein
LNTGRPYHVDNIISAEIPPHGSALHSIIERCNIHGPCSATNPKNPCMKSGICSKHFPKGFQLATTIGEGAYPNYRWQSLEDGGQFYTTLTHGQEIRITNENVVPYNPMLSVLMDSHINVEFRATIKAIQYLFKYQLNGSDQATISIVAGDDREQDEVATFMSKRYVSSMDASWRIFQFSIIAVKPAIIHLPIPLGNQQHILYDPTNPVQAQ